MVHAAARGTATSCVQQARSMAKRRMRVRAVWVVVVVVLLGCCCRGRGHGCGEVGSVGALRTGTDEVARA